MRESNDDRSSLAGEMPEGADILGGDVLGRSLAAWAADAAVDEAAASRARRHWLTVQAEAEASVAGVLLSLGERGRRVMLGVGDTTVRGRVVGLGADFAVVERPDGGGAVIVALDMIGLVRSTDETPVRGDRQVRLDTTLAGIMGPIAADRPTVVAHTPSGPVHGTLRSAGDDVLRLHTDAGLAWVPIAALRMLVLS